MSLLVKSSALHFEQGAIWAKALEKSSRLGPEGTEDGSGTEGRLVNRYQHGFTAHLRRETRGLEL